MDNNIEVTLLYDAYGKNLTKRQQEIFEEYYLYNLSLREIAENKSISYQAVRDSLEKSKDILYEFEKNIGMLKLKKDINSLKNLIEKNQDDLNSVKCELIEKINEISEVE